MQVCFKPYLRRDGTQMLYINRSNKVSVGLSPEKGWAPFGAGVTEGMRNVVNAAKGTFLANARPFTGEISKHTETGFCAAVQCGPYTLVGTDVANIGGMDVGSDGAYVIRDGMILKCGVWFDEVAE